MNLAIFDIDGTLLQTNQVDGSCYDQALQETVGGGQGWDDCSHMTDFCIFGELFEREHNRSPEASEVEHIIDLFVHLLEKAFEANPLSIVETAGAQELLNVLNQHSDWHVTIATGGWHKSAGFKFQCAEIIIGDIPISTANDGISREEIVNDAVAKAEQKYGVQGFKKMVSIGDAPWDFHTAKNLNLPLIGVGDRLEGYDVRVVQDFREADAFLQLLEEV